MDAKAGLWISILNSTTADVRAALGLREEQDPNVWLMRLGEAATGVPCHEQQEPSVRGRRVSPEYAITLVTRHSLARECVEGWRKSETHLERRDKILALGDNPDPDDLAEIDPNLVTIVCSQCTTPVEMAAELRSTGEEDGDVVMLVCLPCLIDAVALFPDSLYKHIAMARGPVLVAWTPRDRPESIVQQVLAARAGQNTGYDIGWQDACGSILRHLAGEVVVEAPAPPVEIVGGPVEGLEPPCGGQVPPRDLARELSSLLNCHSCENESDTPDFILAEMLLAVLTTWNKTTKQRDQWFGRPCGDGAAIGLHLQTTAGPPPDDPSSVVSTVAPGG